MQSAVSKWEWKIARGLRKTPGPAQDVLSRSKRKMTAAHWKNQYSPSSAGSSADATTVVVVKESGRRDEREERVHMRSVGGRTQRTFD